MLGISKILLIFLIQTSYGLVPNPSDCCVSKTVEGTTYTLVGHRHTTAYSCIDDCVYRIEGDIQEYCFAPGKYAMETCAATHLTSEYPAPQECNCPTTKEYECPTPKECECPTATVNELPTTIPESTQEYTRPSIPEPTQESTRPSIPESTQESTRPSIPESTQESTRPSIHESEFDEGSPLLYLGAGLFSGLRAVPEIVSLPVIGQGDEQIINPSKSACFIEESPLKSATGSVAFVYNGIFTECGGSVGYNGDYSNMEEDSPYSRDCYSMINFEWIATTPMLTRRYGAAAVVMENGSVLVSGGQEDTSGLRLATTEIYNGTGWTKGSNLPHAVAEHCMMVLPGENLLLVGGWLSRGFGEGPYGETSSTYIYSNNTGLWTEKANMSIYRNYPACAVYNGEVWVGGHGDPDKPSGSVEIYSPANDMWREGPYLPYTTIVPGSFVSHGQALIYAGGYDLYNFNTGGFDTDFGRQMHQLNKGMDGWTFILNMTDPRYDFPVLVISEAECNGVSYSSDGNTGIVAGSILDVLNNLTQSSVEVEVNCCTQGVVSTPKICGNGVSCETICGEHNKEFAILSLTTDASDAEVCPLVYKRHFVITTTIYQLSYCPHRVRNVNQLKSYKQCCLHPAVYRKPGIKKTCCSYGLCV